MRTLLPAIAAAAVLLGSVWSSTAVGSVANGRGEFLDDDGSIHEPDINGLAQAGITRGCNPPANTNYCPHDPVTRAQMAAFLVRALGLTDTGTTFADTSGHLFEADISKLAAAAITRGCNPPANTNYCPHDPVTRAQMATFLVRALDLPPSTTNPFTDTHNSIHQQDINALAQAGITRGCNPPANTNYCPHDPVTRAQMATFLVRALDHVTAQRNRLSLREGLTCAKNGLACSSRLTLARGTQLEVVEGWYQVLPYQTGEESAFKASGTSVTLSWNGSGVDANYLGLTESTSPATRLWQGTLPPLTPGTHTLRAVWRWNGAATQTVTFTIVVP